MGTKAIRHRTWSFLVLILVNAVLLSGAFFMYGRYTLAYQRSLREENLSNISNLNKSSMAIVTAVLESWNTKLNDVSGYIAHDRMTYEQACDMINASNSQDNVFFQILNSEFEGHHLEKDENGVYPAVSYAHGSYLVQQNAFKDMSDDETKISFVPEFTNDLTKKKVFAIYRHISLTEDDGATQIYTLLLASDSENVLAAINNLSGYVDQSTVLIDEKGNYIIKNRDFTSTNFYQYLANSNDLSLDKTNEIRDEVLKNGQGELLYKNSKASGQDCVFRYEKMEENNWYCVTAVPEESFTLPDFNMSYIVYTVAFLILLLVIDIAWLQTTNSKLRASARREAAANNAKSSFMSRMSHEIRTPLNAVIGYNTIARNELDSIQNEEERKLAEARVMDCLVKSDIASKHLLTIINDVLDMSAIESGKITVSHERFDLKALISSLTTVFYSQAHAKDVNFEVTLEALTEEWFVGDQMRTNQILTNLLSNAIKFTSGGGNVKLQVSQPEPETNPAHLHFVITDTGIGMSPDYMNRIWAPFEQADSSISRRFGGTGLGLTITKNLVDLMNGTITADSKPGVGTTFTVDLIFESTEQPDSECVYDFSNIKALVVDDDACSCEYIRQLFMQCGVKCDVAFSGEQALTAFRESAKQKEEYNLCLVDWRMPKMDGIETIRKLHDIDKNDVPIIVITAYDLSEVAAKAAEVGVSTLIAKPLFRSSLFDMLVSIGENSKAKATVKSNSYDFVGKHILLAEDNEMNMEIAKKILESSGLVVSSANNGQEAVEIFENSEPGTFACILMDIHMPVMDGHTATRAIRASSHPEAKTIPIIAMTADAFAENVAQAYEAGMDGHIAKPIDIVILFDTITKHTSKQKGE